MAEGAEMAEWRGGVVNLFAQERNRSRDRVSANLGHVLGRGYRCLVHYDTERAKENRRGG